MKKKIEIQYILFSILASQAALAELRVTPVAPWTVSSENVYFRHDANPPSVVTGSGYRAIDFQKKAADEVVNNRPSLIVLDVSSTKTDFEAGQLIISATAADSEGGSVDVPIAYANGDCPAACQNSSDAYYLAARYNEGANLQIGIYLADLCYFARNILNKTGTELPKGCEDDAGTGKVELPTTALTQFDLTFRIGVIPTGSADVVPPADKIAIETAKLKLSLEGTTPFFNGCPDLSKFYFPGDGEIVTESRIFVGNGINTGGAPITTLVVIGEDNAAPAQGLSYHSNSIVSELDIGGGGQPVSGLINTSDGVDHKYNFLFSPRDAAGVVGPFSCPLNGVQTASISGFLKKDNCFIATAAFGDGDASPVKLLKLFRDTFLLRFKWGREFVSWYYSWSPSAADWLTSNPVFKLPVLQLLLPFELVAFVIVHPAVIIIWLMLSMITLFLIFRQKLFLVCLLGIMCASDLRAATTSQPYIDQLREGLSEPESEGSYSQKVKENLPEEQIDIPEGKYIEVLKKSAPEQFEKKTEGEYIEEQKAKLPPKVEHSAIQDVKEGKSKLKARYDENITQAVSLRVGTVLSRTIKASNSNARPFKDVYGGNWVPDIALFYEYQPFHSEKVGNVGLVFGSGLAYYHGKGHFQFNLPNPALPGQSFGVESRTKFQFFTVPAFAGANFRFNLLKILRPYVQAGPQLMFYYERRNDNRAALKGYSKTILVNGGVNIYVDWLDPEASWSLYTAQGVKKYSVALDYSRMLTFAGDVDFSISGFSVGFTYEF